MTEKNPQPNALINESSPYLLQHAHNPVNWLPYSKAAFEKAQQENKLVLISIGYSACHWCHVMEHESFENQEVANIMNGQFINIKVDREERSDVDMVYMQAVQLMTGQGGWPLNCFALPDGRPVYGGTYFNRQQWMNVLKNLSDLYKNDAQKVLEYAENLTGGMNQAELIVTGKKSETPIDFTLLKSAVKKWKTGFDTKYGGPAKAPKFPLPGNYLFLMRYGLMERDREVTDHVQLTLQTMANGGIYDQLRGGFARYSVDLEWKVPHFEKMLYDNAQLVSLYCEAYRHFKNPLYKKVVMETLDFVSKEWQLPEGGFYSAYDADSEGEEGKYYVWGKEELHGLLKDDFDVFAEAYNVNDTGYWEHGNYILMRNHNVSLLAVKYKMSLEELNAKLEQCKEKLRTAADNRVKPGLDDKTITSWNAMMCSAFARAYQTFGEEKHKAAALASIEFILKHLRTKNGNLFRTYKNGKAKINGFLEDYAFVSEALMEVYVITADGSYLQLAKELTDKALAQFHNPESALLYYTGSGSESLVTRSTEASDNVVPASNSQMALNLFYLSQHFSEEAYAEKASDMLSVVQEEMAHYAPGYSNWACLALHVTRPFRQVAIVGNNVNEKMLELGKHSFTNTILAVSWNNSNLPLLINRHVAGQTLIYVCKNNTCQLPVTTVEEALEQF